MSDIGFGWRCIKPSEAQIEERLEEVALECEHLEEECQEWEEKYYEEQSEIDKLQARVKELEGVLKEIKNTASHQIPTGRSLSPYGEIYRLASEVIMKCPECGVRTRKPLFRDRPKGESANFVCRECLKSKPDAPKPPSDVKELERALEGVKDET